MLTGARASRNLAIRHCSRHQVRFAKILPPKNSNFAGPARLVGPPYIFMLMIDFQIAFYTPDPGDALREALR
jgi:hypothetical protein